MTEKVDEFVRSENVLVTMDKRTLNKRRSRLESASEVDGPKYKYAPPPPPLPPPPTLPANLPLKVTRDGEQPEAMGPAGKGGDWSQEIRERRSTLRKDAEQLNDCHAPGFYF